MQIESDEGLEIRVPFKWAAASDIGKEREENEDTFIVEAEVGLFLVSDGMGGHRGGELASKIVTEDLSVMIETNLDKLKVGTARTIRSIFKRAIVEQNKQLQLESTSESGYKDMGATLVMVLLRDGRAYVGNLGDSRMYRFRGGRLAQVTKDHSVISELLDKGHIEPEEAENHEAQGQITRYVGMEEKARPHVRSFGVKKGDRLVLCTDGLTDMVNDKEIGSILRKQEDCKSACEALVKAANTAGGHDNITVVVIDWQGR
jgi:serine/threonine protein phosphatase PrpC